MFVLKKLILLSAIMVIAILCVLIYWSQHLVFKAEEIGDTEQRIEVLEKAVKFYPWNDLVFYELGKAYHELGSQSLGEQGRSSIHIQKSIIQLRRSLKINPTSYFGHFYLAQAFHNMGFDSPSYEERAYQEFKKAVHLAGQNTEVLYEVGKVFLSQWPSLSQEDRDFTIEILKKVVEGRDRERIQSLFYTWEINAEDYEVMDKIFPEDSQTYRDFAEFLGERGLSLEERQGYLAKAELLEFRRAQDIFEAGEHAFFYFSFEEAQPHFKSCLNILKKIHFYQKMLPIQSQIEPSEFEELNKQALLNLVKSYLEQGAEFKDVEDYLWEYLEKEDKAKAIGELESYLKGKGLGREDASSRFNDLGRLAFQLYLSLKQGRFRDNMNVGRDILRSFGVVPGGEEDRFVKILEIVGESFQKEDFIYDSNDFYDKALEWDPDNLGILVKLRRNYERLRAEKDVREIDRRIGEIVSPPEMDVGRSLSRGQTYRRSIVLDGREIHLGLHFGEWEGDRELLMTVLFNGRLVWEDYIKGDVVSVPVETKVGDNVVQIVLVNRDVELRKITYE